MQLKDHDLTAPAAVPGVLYDEAALRDLQGRPVPGLHAYASSSERLVQRGYF